MAFRVELEWNWGGASRIHLFNTSLGEQPTEAQRRPFSSERIRSRAGG